MSWNETLSWLRSQNSEWPRIFPVTGANQNVQKLIVIHWFEKRYWKTLFQTFFKVIYCKMAKHINSGYNHVCYSVYPWIPQSEHPVIKCQFLNKFFPWEDQNPQFTSSGSLNFVSRGFIFLCLFLYKFISFQRQFNPQFLARFWSVIYQPEKSRSSM